MSGKVEKNFDIGKGKPDADFSPILFQLMIKSPYDKDDRMALVGNAEMVFLVSG